MDLLDRLAAMADDSYYARPPRHNPLLDRLWRLLKQSAQWLMSALALLWRFGLRSMYRFAGALGDVGSGALQDMRAMALRIAKNRRVQGVAALIGVCAL